MKSITKWLLSLYVAGAIITMGFQISIDTQLVREPANADLP